MNQLLAALAIRLTCVTKAQVRHNQRDAGSSTHSWALAPGEVLVCQARCGAQRPGCMRISRLASGASISAIQPHEPPAARAHERIHLVVLANQPCPGGLGAVCDHPRSAKDKLAPYKYSRWIEFLNELPNTATGKIQRFKLRA